MRRAIPPWARRVTKTILCALTAMACLAFLETIVSAMHMRIWGTHEFLTVAAVVALLISICVSAAIGSLVGVGMRLSWILRAIGIVAGLLAFYLQAASRGGAFFEGALSSYRDMYSNDTYWGLIMLGVLAWVVIGLVISNGLQPLVRGGARRTVAVTIGMLLFGTLILYSTYYPVAKSEMQQCEFAHRSIQKLIEKRENDKRRSIRVEGDKLEIESQPHE